MSLDTVLTQNTTSENFIDGDAPAFLYHSGVIGIQVPGSEDVALAKLLDATTFCLFICVVRETCV